VYLSRQKIEADPTEGNDAREVLDDVFGL